MSVDDVVCLAACACVIAAFHATDPIRLRRIAGASNLLFITYGLMLSLWLIVGLHAILLALNVKRLSEAAGRSCEPALGAYARELVERDIRLNLAGYRCTRFV